MSGKRVILFFYGSIGVLALIGLGLVLWVKSQPAQEWEQKKFGGMLNLAYQKYRFDQMAWPQDAKDAAYNFKSENQQMPELVDKAEEDWGLKAIVEERADKAFLIVTYEKPKPMRREYELSLKKR